MAPTMTPNLPPNPQTPHRYTEPTTPTERHRNAREALAFVSNFPELQDWIRDVQISPLTARASHQIDDIANTLANQQELDKQWGQRTLNLMHQRIDKINHMIAQYTASKES